MSGVLQPVRFYAAVVRGGRLTLNEPTDMPDGTQLELVPADDILRRGGLVVEVTAITRQRPR